jgi:peptidoglycan/xylan/chitin deacetylase (PgdA/CDA1 family)
VILLVAIAAAIAVILASGTGGGARSLGGQGGASLLTRARAHARAGAGTSAGAQAGVDAGTGANARAGAGVGTGAGMRAGAGARTGAGAGWSAKSQLIAENHAIDRTLAYTPYVRIAGSQHRELALSFDDGPGPYTPRILAILGRYHVPATFFEVGILERYFHASTREIVNRGYAIGDHTFSHYPMSLLSPSDQRVQLLEGAHALERYGAAFPRLFRPPYGRWSSYTLALLRRYRMLMVLWTVDTSDYLRPGAGAILKAALAGARPGAIILLHDAGGDRVDTVAALPKILKRLRARGYRLVTVPKLLLDNPAPRNQRVSLAAGTGG